MRVKRVQLVKLSEIQLNGVVMDWIAPINLPIRSGIGDLIMCTRVGVDRQLFAGRIRVGEVEFATSSGIGAGRFPRTDGCIIPTIKNRKKTEK